MAQFARTNAQKNQTRPDQQREQEEEAEGYQQAVHVLGTPDQGGEASQLLRQRQQNLVLIIDCI